MIKAIITACLMGFAVPALAGDGYDSAYIQRVMANMHAKPGDCVESDRMFFSVVKAIDDTGYEIAAFAEGHLVARGLLKTTETKFASAGRLRISMKYLGSMEGPKADGFKTTYGVWQECKVSL